MSTRQKDAASAITKGDDLLSARREAAVDFLRSAVSGRIREAAKRHCAPGFRHHNPHFAGDGESWIAAIDADARAHPRNAIDVKRTIAEGELVAVHSHVRHEPADAGYAVVHVFRFEGTRIVEAWDVGMVVPEDSPNENGVF